jgi:hypothetical protein
MKSMRKTEEVPSSRGLSIMSIVLIAVGGIAVPPSFTRRGLSPAERFLADSTVPVLAGAFGIALFALMIALGPHQVAARRVALLSLALLNLSGFLSGQFGVDGAHLMGTLVLTSPLLVVIALRELAERRRRASGAR